MVFNHYNLFHPIANNAQLRTAKIREIKASLSSAFCQSSGDLGSNGKPQTDHAVWFQRHRNRPGNRIGVFPKNYFENPVGTVCLVHQAGGPKATGAWDSKLGVSEDTRWGTFKSPFCIFFSHMGERAKY